MPKTKTKRHGGGRKDQYAGPYDGSHEDWNTRTMTSSIGKKTHRMVPSSSKPTEAKVAMEQSHGEQAYLKKTTGRKPSKKKSPGYSYGPISSKGKGPTTSK